MKNILIIILIFATVACMLIAIKNSKPIDCDYIVYTEENKTLCILELNGHSSRKIIEDAIKQRYQEQDIL